MNDAILRTRLIRLASEHPEFRKDLLPLIKSAGSESDKEARSQKQGGSATHRATIGFRVRTTRVTPVPMGARWVEGVMTMTRGVEDVAPLKFEASVLDNGGGFYEVVTFAPLRAVSGAGAEGLLSFYKEMFSEIIAANPDLVALR